FNTIILDTIFNVYIFFFSSRRRHTRSKRDWSSDVCSSDLTITLYDYIQSELIKKGLNEFVDSEGELVIFEEDHQFIEKIFRYDEDIQQIINFLFFGNGLIDEEYDKHSKKNFLYKFLNRQINHQTIE